MTKQSTIINPNTKDDDASKLWSMILEQLESGKPIKVTLESASIGKWTMTRLWRSWMGSTADFMARNGCTMPLVIKNNGETYGTRPFNQNDAHDLFVSQWLGVDADGNRLSFATSGDNAATKGERFMAMLKHEEWMVNKGIKYMIPADSEYFKTKQESE